MRDITVGYRKFLIYNVIEVELFGKKEMSPNTKIQ